MAVVGVAWAQTTYTKVTTAPADWSGTYVIVADDSNVAFTGQSGSNNYGGYAAVTITNGTVTGNFSDYEVLIEKSGDYYTMKHVSSGKYLGWNSGNNLHFSTDEPTTNAFKWNLSTSSILNASDNARKLQYNSSSPRFACYTSSQKVAYLYLKESVSPTTVATTTTIDASGITNTDVYTGTAAGSLTATVTETESENAVSGATVTWTSSKENVATIDENGVVTLVAAGTTTITASYAGVSGEFGASSATYELTVTSSAPYEQPTEFEIGLNNALFGTEYTGSVSNITDANPIVGTQDNVTVTYAGGGNHYVNDAQIRFYPSNKLTFEAPEGYEIKEIVFTAGDTWTATITANVGTYTDASKTWTGNASSVVFTGSDSGQCRMTKATITLAEPSTDPSITVSPTEVEVEAAGGSGQLTMTALNMGDGALYLVQEVDASGEEVDYDWLEAEIDEEGNSPVTYTVSANTSTEERVAYLRVWGVTDNSDEVYSNVVTFTQAGYVEPFTPTTYSLATSITHGIHYIIVSGKEDGAAKAMGSQTSNNRASADVTINNGKATVNSADVYEFVISGPNADGFYTIYDENTNSTGYLYAASSGSNHLRTQETNDANGMWSIEFDSETNAATIKAQGSNTRNLMRFNSSNGIFSCYGSGQQDIYLFAKDNDEPSSVLVTIKDGFTATTFSSDKALDFTNADVTAQIITDEQGTTQDVTVVPAETGLYITGQPGVHEISVADASAETDNVDSNKLKAVLEASEFATQNDVTFYAFGKQKGKEAFYKIPTSGYNVPAGKAVLRILKNSANAPEMIVVNSGTTGVESIENSQLTIDNYYTVDGRLVNGKPTQKGIYIVGGRKVVVK